MTESLLDRDRPAGDELPQPVHDLVGGLGGDRKVVGERPGVEVPEHGAVGADPDQDCGVLSPPGFFHSFQNRLSRSLAGDNADWVDGEIGRSRLSNWSGSANA